MHSELNMYYKQIRQALPGNVFNRRRIMAGIKNGIEEYRLQNPDADMAQIKAHFGSPEQIAAAYIEEQSTGQLLKALHIRHKIVAIVAGVMAVILLSWAIFITSEIVNSHNQKYGYIVTEQGISHGATTETNAP